jgi:hypothetical protein
MIFQKCTDDYEARNEVQSIVEATQLQLWEGMILLDLVKNTKLRVMGYTGGWWALSFLHQNSSSLSASYWIFWLLSILLLAASYHHLSMC